MTRIICLPVLLILLLLLSSCREKQPVITTPPHFVNDLPYPYASCVYCASDARKNIALIKTEEQFKQRPYYKSDSAAIVYVDFAKHDLLIVSSSDLPTYWKMKYPPTTLGNERTMYAYTVNCHRKNDTVAILMSSREGFHWATIPKSATDSVNCGCSGGLPSYNIMVTPGK
ncbi:MAG: hypothetical protein FD123_3090 [Bacteroidetes bacterium]|nr:MAG: hypothetical protein FD123_3090 [Bacteroidota bacterium]